MAFTDTLKHVERKVPRRLRATALACILVIAAACADSVEDRQASDNNRDEVPANPTEAPPITTARQQHESIPITTTGPQTIADLPVELLGNEWAQALRDELIEKVSDPAHQLSILVDFACDQYSDLSQEVPGSGQALGSNYYLKVAQVYYSFVQDRAKLPDFGKTLVSEAKDVCPEALFSSYISTGN